VTVYGAKGDVSITHEKAGVESGSWPLVTDGKSKTPIAKAIPGSTKKAVKMHEIVDESSDSEDEELDAEGMAAFRAMQAEADREIAEMEAKKTKRGARGEKASR